MDLDLPQHLQSTRQCLVASLRLHPGDGAPPAPASLMEDLGRRFTQANQVQASRKTSLMAKLTALISSPAFGVSATAIMVLGVWNSSMEEPEPGPELIRGVGGGYTQSTSVQIVLVSAPSGVRSLVESSGDFERDLVSGVNRLEITNGIPNPKVIVDFGKSKLYSINSNGKTVHTAGIPEDTADLSDAILMAITRL